MNSNQRGQGVVEAVLLMVVLMGFAHMVTQYFQSSKIAQKLTAGPWSKLEGMIECGVWEPCQGGTGLHPSTIDRSNSRDAKP